MKERNKTIDILRGIAVIAVLLGHAIQRGLTHNFENNLIFKIIYTFHMPLFIILSGYSMKQYTPKYDANFIKKKFNQLILPTIIWSYLIYFVKDLCFVGIKPFINFPNSLITYTQTLILHPDFIIWFLYILFLCMTIVCIFKIFSNNKFHFLIYTIFIEIFLIILSKFMGNYLGIYRLTFYFPFFIIGYYSSEYTNILKKYLKSNYIFGISIIGYLLLFKYYTAGSLSIIHYPISLFATIILYKFSNFIKKNNIITNFLYFFSKFSLQIYLLQCICLNIGFGNNYIRICSIFISATIISSLLALIINKNKFLNFILFQKK